MFASRVSRDDLWWGGVETVSRWVEKEREVLVLVARESRIAKVVHECCSPLFICDTEKGARSRKSVLFGFGCELALHFKHCGDDFTGCFNEL